MKARSDKDSEKNVDFTRMGGRINVDSNMTTTKETMRSMQNKSKAMRTIVLKKTPSNLPYPYWKLSCPLEMSTFSPANMEADERAEQARRVAMAAVEPLKQFFHSHSRLLTHSRRIYFLGDSLLRQLYISLVCHLHHYFPQQVNIAVSWFTKRQGRTQQTNSIAIGQHSKFEEARVWWRLSPNTTIEFVFHHAIGGIISLGRDYEVHDTHFWLEDCFRRRPFQATIISEESLRHRVITERNVERETVPVRSHDIVLLNGSVHGARTMNLHGVKDLLQCIQDQSLEKTYPRFAYVMTGAQHFPTSTHEWEMSLVNQSEYECIRETARRVKQQEEIRLFQGLALLPIIGDDIVEQQYKYGYLHVGNRDCLHWAMPGIPDLMAMALIHKLQELKW